MNERQHLQSILKKQSKQDRSDYRVHLNVAVDCARFLLNQGSAFCGHDESDNSNNPGNFKAAIKLISKDNEELTRLIRKCPKNLKLTSSDIQKDIVHSCAIETINNVIHNLGNAFFAILVEEARDVSTQEQMAIVILYVNNKGHIIERFLDIVHVRDTSALSLKAAIDATFSKYNLSMSRLRGQGYDGASNMQGQFNGLKALILSLNENAFYVHCFAHQLQLALVAVAKSTDLSIGFLFSVVSNVVNIVGGSCKRHDMLLESQASMVLKAVENGELESGRGKNQTCTLKRAGETRWGSHYHTLISLIKMFFAISDVLEFVQDNGHSDQKLEARTLLSSLHSFEFAFCLHLMKCILGISNELSQALQRKDQDIVNAMNLVSITKKRLQLMRDNGWNSLLDEVSLFCNEHNIYVLDLDGVYIPLGRSRRNIVEVKKFHHYKFDLFHEVLDLQLKELNNQFNEGNTKLLLCFSCLSPVDSFFAFDKEKLLRVAQLYPKDFSSTQLVALDNQLETYIMDMKSTFELLNMKGISELAEQMVRSRKDIVYPLVYRLITLAHILPVATATVERAFSAMKFVKNKLRNKMGDQWMTDCLVTYVEKDIFNAIDNEVIMLRYQGMKIRREEL